MAPVWILMLILELVNRATCDYHCTMQSSEVTCSGLNSKHLSQDLSVTVNKTDIVILNLTNGIVSTLSETTFKDFTNLQSLYVSNCKLSNLDDNAFSHSLDLTHLYLNNNTLTEFNSGSLPAENGLSILDLSNNRLSDLSDFNVSYFPKLSVLNLASNFLSSLPVSLLEKLAERNQFYLVVDNNPWNCSDPNWSYYLSDGLIEAFCSNNTFQSNVEGEIIARVTDTTTNTPTTDAERNVSISLGQNIQDYGIENDDGDEMYPKLENNLTNPEINERKINNTKSDCFKCSFYYCLYWFFGGIWIGIIIGNIPNIRKLICSRHVVYSDQATQCEHSIADQYMVSGFRLDFNSRESNIRSINKEKAISETSNT